MEKSKSMHSRRVISWPLEMLLRIVGIWPGVSCSSFRKMFWFILIVFNTFSQILFIVYQSNVNISLYIYACAGLLTMIVKAIKIFIMWYNQRKFDEMWETLLTSWERSSDYDKSAITTIDKKHIVHYMPNFVVAFHAASVIMTTLGNLYAGMGNVEGSNRTRVYPMPTHLLFDMTQTMYVILIFQQLFYLWIMTATSATLNAVLIILMLYLGDQIDVLCTCLIKMPPKDDDRKMNKIMMREIIRKHQSVISFSKNIEALYTYMALMIVVCNTLISCGLAYTIVKAIGTPIFAKILRKNLLYYCSINIETFVFCISGEYLSGKSKTVGEAAYYSPWYQSKFHSNAVLFMIIRSQNLLTITTAKIMDLSLEQFSNILKTSMSYLSVLLAMY